RLGERQMAKLTSLPATVRGPSTAGMYLPSDIYTDGVFWYAPLQQPKPNNSKARRRIAAQKAFVAKINARYADYQQSLAYADYLLNRELALTEKAGQQQRAPLSV